MRKRMNERKSPSSLPPPPLPLLLSVDPHSAVSCSRRVGLFCHSHPVKLTDSAAYRAPQPVVKATQHLASLTRSLLPSTSWPTKPITSLHRQIPTCSKVTTGQAERQAPCHKNHVPPSFHSLPSATLLLPRL